MVTYSVDVHNDEGKELAGGRGEESTKNYIIVVVASERSHRIILIIVREFNL